MMYFLISVSILQQKMHCIVDMHMFITNSTFLHMKTMKLKALFCLLYNQVPVHNDSAIGVDLGSKYMLDQWHVLFFGAVGSFQGRWYNVCLINSFLVCLVGALTFKVIVYSFAQEVYHKSNKNFCHVLKAPASTGICHLSEPVQHTFKNRTGHSNDLWNIYISALNKLKFRKKVLQNFSTAVCVLEKDMITARSLFMAGKIFTLSLESLLYFTIHCKECTSYCDKK